MYDPDRIDDLSAMLSQFERILLEYEHAVQTGVISGEQLRGILWPLEGVKAAAWQANLGAAATLVHDIESLVVAHQNRVESLSREAVDALLGAIDVIVASLKGDARFRSELRNCSMRVNALIAELHSTTRPGKQPRFPFALTAREAALAKLAIGRGESPVIIEKLVSTDVDVRAYARLSIFDGIRQIGQVVAVRSESGHFQRSRNELMLTFVVASKILGDEIGRTFFDPFTPCDWPASNATTIIESEALGSLTRVLASPDAERGSQTMRRASLRKRILIVEDEFVSRSILLALLGECGACDVAVDGREAIEAFTEAVKVDQPYALVTLDIMMPELDGHQVLQQMRQIEANSKLALGQRARIIMTTALTDFENFHRAYQGSCDAFIVKPIAKATLLRQLSRVGIVASTGSTGGWHAITELGELDGPESMPRQAAAGEQP